MLELKAFALRNGDSIEVTISGNLPTSCNRAVINDIYPGGNVQYVRDPGKAQVFILEWVIKGAILCPMVLVPWSASVIIPSDRHKEVAILINGQEVKVVPVDEKDSYEVYVLDGFVPDHTYVIVPESAPLQRPWRQVFGPDNYKACSEWLLAHRPHGSFVEDFAGKEGGGSDAPRGQLIF